jgi:flagellar motor switch protein FliN/FliY
MTDRQALSQEEIDSLFQMDKTSIGPTLTPAQADALGEIGNISFGSAATALSTLLQHRVEITTPSVSVVDAAGIQEQFPKPYVLVSVEYTEGLKGSNALAIELSDAKTIADLMLGGDGTNTLDELNDLHLSAVGEAMNQMMGGAATSMSQIFGQRIDISPPKVQVVDLSSKEQVNLGFEGPIVNVEFSIKVDHLIDSKIMQLMPYPFANVILGQLGVGGADATVHSQSTETAPSRSPSTAERTRRPEHGTVATEGSAVASHASMQSVPPAPPANALAASFKRPEAVIQQPEFSDFDGLEVTSVGSSRNLSLLFDVPLSITVELGRTKRLIRDILDLAPGSIVELDKLAGEPVDILVNNKKIATGEVVVIDENFGVRLTDIISPSERVRSL